MAQPWTRYAVDVESSDDAVIDAELIRFEDERRTIEEVAVLCRQLGLRARLLDEDTGERLEVAADGSWRPAAAPWREAPSGHPSEAP